MPLVLSVAANMDSKGWLPSQCRTNAIERGRRVLNTLSGIVVTSSELREMRVQIDEALTGASDRCKVCNGQKSVTGEDVGWSNTDFCSWDCHQRYVHRPVCGNCGKSEMGPTPFACPSCNGTMCVPRALPVPSMQS